MGLPLLVFILLVCAALLARAVLSARRHGRAHALDLAVTAAAGAGEWASASTQADAHVEAVVAAAGPADAALIDACLRAALLRAVSGRGEAPGYVERAVRIGRALPGPRPLAPALVTFAAQSRAAGHDEPARLALTEAMRAWREARRGEPEELRRAVEALAAVEGATGHPARAAALWKEAAEAARTGRDPRLPTLEAHLVAALTEAGDHPEATRVAQARLDAADADTRGAAAALLADTKLAGGDRAGAEASWRAAIAWSVETGDGGHASAVAEQLADHLVARGATEEGVATLRDTLGPLRAAAHLDPELLPSLAKHLRTLATLVPAAEADELRTEAEDLQRAVHEHMAAIAGG